MSNLLILFVCVKLLRDGFESWLSHVNRQYYLKTENQKEACNLLAISKDDLSKSLKYSEDRHKFGQLTEWVQAIIFVVFLCIGGFGWVEEVAFKFSNFFNGGSILTGIFFFGILGTFSFILGLPINYYLTFVIEERHGFNRQTLKGFVSDHIKSIILGSLIGGCLLLAILWVMTKFDQWWLYAWILLSLFSLVISWLYPTLLAPLFNKFKPLEDGELKNQINRLAEKVGFQASEIFVMDASTRSSHGNAYFTGVFGKKRIVLFDTLVSALSPTQVTAVLAHELGHFKLNHVRWGLIRGFVSTGVMFFLLSLCLPLEPFYQAFYLKGVSNYGALFVFSSWWGIIDFFLSPLNSWISRKNEFAADDFAKTHMQESRQLGEALLKLRENSHSMPISHPLYSTIYHSHPPLIERLKAMGFFNENSVKTS